MVTRRYLVCFLVVACFGSGINAVGQQPTPSSGENQKLDIKLPVELGKPVPFKNLVVIPILAKTRTPASTDYYTLDQALKAGMVEVREGKTAEGANSLQVGSLQTGQINRQEQQRQTGGGNRGHQDGNRAQQRQSRGNQRGIRNNRQQVDTNNFSNNNRSGRQVNRVFVVNKSDKNLYLMPGEIILGGDQDRMIAKETLIPPKSKPIAVSVFCVERGRWGQRSQSLTNQALKIIREKSKGDVAFDKKIKNLAEASNKGRFIGSVGNVSNSVRLAGQLDQNQQRVWSSVDFENRKSKLSPKSSTFTSNYSTAKTLKRMESYIDKVRPEVTKLKNVTGVMIVINGDIKSLDIFASPALFRSLWPKMCKSFALEAANAVDEKSKSGAFDRRKAQQFLANATSGRLKSKATANQVTVRQIENNSTVSFLANHSSESRLDKLLHISAFPRTTKDRKK